MRASPLNPYVVKWPQSDTCCRKLWERCCSLLPACALRVYISKTVFGAAFSPRCMSSALPSTSHSAGAVWGHGSWAPAVVCAIPRGKAHPSGGEDAFAAPARSADPHRRGKGRGHSFVAFCAGGEGKDCVGSSPSSIWLRCLLASGAPWLHLRQAASLPRPQKWHFFLLSISFFVLQAGLSRVWAPIKEKERKNYCLFIK